MTREHEYEVLKRHDVYVVRKVGTQEYVTRFFGGEWSGYSRFWGMGDAADAHGFSFKWRAILHAKSLERKDRANARVASLVSARKSATEERVWR